MQMTPLFLIVFFLMYHEKVQAQSMESLRNRLFLTETYGLLSNRELRFCQSQSRIDDKNTYLNGIVTWQCAPSKSVKIACTSFDPGSIEGGYPYVMMTIAGKRNRYLYHKGFGEAFCRDQMTVLRRVLKAKYVCIAGSYVGESDDDKNELIWTFERLKSKTGDYCEFVNKEWGCETLM